MIKTSSAILLLFVLIAFICCVGVFVTSFFVKSWPWLYTALSFGGVCGFYEIGHWILKR